MQPNYACHPAWNFEWTRAVTMGGDRRWGSPGPDEPAPQLQ